MMIRLKNKNKWGFFNPATKCTIECSYDSINDFQNGFAVVNLNNRLGVIDEMGRVIIPFCFTYIDRVEDGIYEVSINNRIKCFYNTEGHIVDEEFCPLNEWLQEYDLATVVSNDIYHVEKDGIESVVSNTKIIYSCTEASQHINEIKIVANFISIHIEYKGYVLSNTNGDVLISGLSHLDVIESVGIIAGQHGEKCIYDFAGNQILHRNYYDINYQGNGRFVLTYTRDYKKENSDESCIYDISQNKFVVKSCGKEILIDLKYDWCDDFANGHALVCVEHKYGYIDINGELCIPCIYDYARRCSGNIGIVKEKEIWSFVNLLTGDKYGNFDFLGEFKNDFCLWGHGSNSGIVNNNGQVILTPQYNEDIEILSDGHFVASRGYRDDKRCNRFNKEGRIVLSINNTEYVLPKEIVWVEPFSEGLALVEDVQSRKGFINESCDLTIPCRFFGYVSNFSNGLARVYVRYDTFAEFESWINKEGMLVVVQCGKQIAIQGEYQLALGSDSNAFIVSNKRKWGLVDVNSNPITDLEYDNIVNLGDGFFKVRKDNKFGVINTSGNTIISCRHADIRLKDNIFEILDGAHFNSQTIMKLSKEGLIIAEDESGIILLPQKFDTVCPYRVGEIHSGYVYCEDNESYLISIATGEAILLPKCNFARYYSDKCIVFGDIFKNEDYNKVGIVNRAGEIVFEKQFRQIKHVIGEIAVFQSNKCGLLSLSRKIILPAEYFSIEIINKDLFKVQIKQEVYNAKKQYSSLEKYQYLNSEGKIVLRDGDKPVNLPKPYIRGGEFHDGLAPVQKQIEPRRFNIEDEFIEALGKIINVWGFINRDGDEVIACKYDIVEDFAGGIARVGMMVAGKMLGSREPQWGLVDNQGNEILPAEYDCIFNIGSSYIIVSGSDEFGILDNAKFGVANQQGQIIIPMEYSDLSLFSKGIIKAQKGGKYGLINMDNSIIIPFCYDDILNQSEDLIAVQKDSLYGFVNLKNQTILEPKYQEVHLFKDGLAWVLKDSWMVVDTTGKIIARIHKDVVFEDFTDGKAKITMRAGEIESEHYLLENGNIVVGKYNLNLDLSNISFIGQFCEGLARVLVNNEWGFLNTKGELVISGIPDIVSDFHCGYTTYENWKFGIQQIDMRGNVICRVNDKEHLFPSRYSAVCHLYDTFYKVLRKENGLCGVIKETGEEVVPFINGNIRWVDYGCDDESVTSSADSLGYFQVELNHTRFNKQNLSCRFYDVLGRQIIPNNGNHIILSDIYKYTEDQLNPQTCIVSNKYGSLGVLCKNGKLIIDCIYDTCYEYNKDCYFVGREDGSQGLILKDGTPLLYGRYADIEEQEDGTFRVIHGEYSETMWYDDYDEYGNQEHEWIPKEHVFNKNGEIQMSLYGEQLAIPREYDWCDKEFKNGFLSVSKNGKWGVIDTRLNKILDCKYDEKIEFENDLAIVSSENLKLVVNTFGQVILSGEYDEIKYCESSGLFICKRKKSSFDVFSEAGELICKISSIFPKTNHGRDIFNIQIPTDLVPLNRRYLKYQTVINRQRKWGIVDIKGNQIIDAQYDDIGGVGSGLIAVAKNMNTRILYDKKWGFVDFAGQIVVDFVYQNVCPFSKGIAWVSKDRYNWGLVSANGKELTGFVYEYSYGFINGCLKAHSNKYKGEIQLTEQGAIHYDYDVKSGDDEYTRDVYLYGYDWCSRLERNHCIVYKNTLQGIIESTGKLTFPLTEMGDVQIVFDERGYLVFKLNGVYRRITEDGRIITEKDGVNVILPEGIRWCDEWKNGHIGVLYNGKYGLIDESLNFVMEADYETIQILEENKVFVTQKDNEGNNVYLIFDINTHGFKELKYDSCSKFEENCAIVSKIVRKTKNWSGQISKEYAYGLIDCCGEELLPCEYSTIEYKEPQKKEASWDAFDYYEEPYSRYDSLMDALDGEPDAYWNID